MSGKTTSRPFGLDHLVPIPSSELAKINGGRHRRHHPNPGGGSGSGGGVLHTMALSLPSAQFPNGDSF
jgi:hypothetical protein